MTRERIELIRNVAEMRHRLPLEMARELLDEIERLQDTVLSCRDIAEAVLWAPEPVTGTKPAGGL